MSTTEFIAHVRIEGHVKEDMSQENIRELLNTRAVMYFPDDEPIIKGDLGIVEIDFIHTNKS